MFRLRHDGALCEGWSTEGHRHRKGGWKAQGKGKSTAGKEDGAAGRVQAR